MYTKAAFMSLVLASASFVTATDQNCGINPSGDPAYYCTASTASTASKRSVPIPTGVPTDFNNCEALAAASIPYSCAVEPTTGATVYARRKRADEMQGAGPVELSTGYDHVTPRITGGPIATGGPIPTGVPLCWSYIWPTASAGGQQPGPEQYPCYKIGDSAPSPQWSLSGNWPEPTHVTGNGIGFDCGGMHDKRAACRPEG